MTMMKEYITPAAELVFLAAEAPICASGDIEGLTDGGDVSW